MILMNTAAIIFFARLYSVFPLFVTMNKEKEFRIVILPPSQAGPGNITSGKKRRKGKEKFHIITKTNSIFYQHLFSVHPSFVLLVAAIDEQNIPVKIIVAVAGKNLTLPCPGVNEHSLIDTLTWKNTQTIAKYVNGMPMVQHQRVSN